MTIKNRRGTCPLCRSDKGDRIIQIDQEQRSLANKINAARFMGGISIKEFSALIDRQDELKKERLNIVSQATYN
ncbi:hypothetical protein AB4Z45_12605 [Paenibacillus sp. MCAF9]|uniref:hypothetical protein n=1 Tax=Paenibacillus sp. MCAF9 TaxID=3233046 RepID=UPI003F968491